MEDEIVFAIKTGYKRILLELIAKKKTGGREKDSSQQQKTFY